MIPSSTRCRQSGVRVSYGLETHLHNDFVSGARELAAATGCQVGASASGAAISFPRLKEDHELDLGEFKLRVLHTLGYTPEHITFRVIKKSPGKEREPNRQTAIFTGGALMLGGAARVDLLGRRIAPFLAR